MLLVSEAGMKKLGLNRDSASELVSYGHATGSLYEETNALELSTTAAAAKAAYNNAGLTPDQVGVCEVHDCFAITEILMYEALGFAEVAAGFGIGRKLGSNGVARANG